MKKILSSPSLKVSIIYAVIAGVWIIWSDRLIEGFESASELQTYKGWFFVAVTAILLYLVTNKLFKQIINRNNELELIQNELFESKELVNDILDSVPQSIFWKNKNSVYMGCNKVFAKMAGFNSPKEIIGKTDYDLPWPEEDTEKYLKDDREIIEKNTIRRNIEEHLYTAEGDDMIISTTKIPLLDINDQIIGILGVFDDITERIKSNSLIRENATKFKNLFESMNEGVAIHDLVFDENNQPIDYIITDVNPSFERQTSILKNSVIGKKATDAYGVENAPYLKEYAEVVLTGNPYEFETYFPPLDKYFNISVTSPRKGSFVTVFQDITENKHAAEEIKNLNAELEERVRLRTGQLESANKELEAFTYSVSHDLRSPLRAIDGFSKILSEDYADNFDDEGKRILEVIRSNTHKMDTLITDLLALSRVTRIDLNLVQIDMKKLAEESFDEIFQNIDSSKYRVNIDEIPEVCGDRTLIKQVWHNLVSNAVKYSSPKEECIIDVGYINENENITYYISDNGVGFNPDYKHKLFGVFQRLHGISEFEGTGVGLAIVERIIKRHQGKVWGEGEINGGAKFYFSIPNNGDCNG